MIKIELITRQLILKFICRTLAHFHAAATVGSLAQFTNEKYRKIFAPVPIQQACSDFTNAMLPNLVSKVYLTEFGFDLKRRTDVHNMVEFLKSSFGQLLNENTWMDSTTKKYAKEKLLAIKPNVAAPDIVFDDKKMEKDNLEVSLYCLQIDH